MMVEPDADLNVDQQEAERNVSDHVPPSVGGIIGSCLRLWWRSLPRLAWLVALPSGATIGTIALANAISHRPTVAGAAIGLLVGGIGAVPCVAVALYLLDDIACHRAIRGVGSALRAAYPHFWAIVIASAVRIAVSLLIAIPGLLALVTHWMMLVLYVPAAIYMSLYFELRWVVSLPCIVLEDRRGIESLRRSSALTAPHRTTVLLALLPVWLIMIVVSFCALLVQFKWPWATPLALLMVGGLLALLGLAFVYSVFRTLRIAPEPSPDDDAMIR